MTNWKRLSPALALTALALALAAGASVSAQAPEGPKPPAPAGEKPGGPGGPGGKDEKDKPEFPEFKEVGKDFNKVVSTADGSDSMWTVYMREKDGQLLAELPRNFEKSRYFFAMTVATGTTFAGLQGPELYVYWKRFDKNLALIEPNLGSRSTGDTESKDSVAQVFTDRVILDVPIVCMGPGGGPVIDLDAMLVGQSDKFFGNGAKNLNAKLASIRSAKAFPQNVEVSIEAPIAGGASGGFGGPGAPAGTLRTFHYSISEIRENPSYKPREADPRVGYFTTTYRDLGQLSKIDKWVRYINRWQLEKADSKLKMSPPKQPVVFYLEHTVPVRYRRWVREGVLWWNHAFETVGITNAIEVYIQDKTTGAHMDKDPEDVRYNFIRWVSNDVSTAIGPSRAHPLTGEILDADIILTDGWIRAFWSISNEITPDLVMDAMPAETLAWLDKHPAWDPRLRLALPGERERILAERAEASRRGLGRYGAVPPALLSALEESGVINGGARGGMPISSLLCMAAAGRAADMSLMGMTMDVFGMIDGDGSALGAEGDKGGGGDKPKDPKEPKEGEETTDKLDGIPEWFIGPMLADLTCHEVGHTLGLRHNFKASAIYTLAQINSNEVKGKKALGGSVMDYNALPNLSLGTGEIQGDYGMIDVGPYDRWAIEYGYTSGDPKKVLERVADADLLYATDEDTIGPDPRARRRDLGADALVFAESRVKLAQLLRAKLIEKFVKDGDSWAKARRGYNITLTQQANALATAAHWVGGALVNRDKKGDPNGRPPVTPVPADKQRAALKFVCENAFKDEAFGLTPELVNKLTVDKWSDDGGLPDLFEDESWPVHDRVLAIQATALTLLMNPTSLGRVYDNEFRVPADQDMITLPEVVNTVTDSIWSELDGKSGGRFTARQPMISSLRRNLQREELDRLIDLSMPEALSGSASKSISTVTTAKLRQLSARIKPMIEGSAGDRLDPYTFAHLSESKLRIDKALDAVYIYNTDKIGSGAPTTIILGSEAAAASSATR